MNICFFLIKRDHFHLHFKAMERTFRLHFMHKIHCLYEIPLSILKQMKEMENNPIKINFNLTTFENKQMDRNSQFV